MKYLALCLLCSCASQNIPACLVDSENSGLQCNDKLNNHFYLNLKQAENYLCFSPEDAKYIIKKALENGGH